MIFFFLFNVPVLSLIAGVSMYGTYKAGRSMSEGCQLKEVKELITRAQKRPHPHP
jgi:hypothetical protein